jgi:hypothetical protein
MKKLKSWLQKVYDRRAKRQYDAAIPVVADEGKGKSTLMLQVAWLWQEMDGREPNVDSVLDTVVWSDRPEFKDAIATSEKRSVVAAHDAARVLHKREAMAGEQIEIEKDLLDVRRMEYLMLLGFQEWDVVPSLLQNRRANFVLRIPQRGIVEGYSRSKIDKKAEDDHASDWWPEPDLRDSFPSLDGTELWEQFEATDEEKKKERMQGENSATPEDVKRKESIKTVIRATQRYNMTYREASSLVDYGKSWVGDVVRDWKDGDYADLVELSPATGAMDNRIQ